MQQEREQTFVNGLGISMEPGAFATVAQGNMIAMFSRVTLIAHVFRRRGGSLSAGRHIRTGAG